MTTAGIDTSKDVEHGAEYPSRLHHQKWTIPTDTPTQTMHSNDMTWDVIVGQASKKNVNNEVTDDEGYRSSVK